MRPLRRRRRPEALAAAVTATLLAASSSAAVEAVEPLRVDAARLERRLAALSRYGADPAGGTSRLAFGDADLAARDWLAGLMRQAGLSVRVDAAGNLIGRREGGEAGLPAILVGSHVDSVPRGGNYDGDVGVIAALECAQMLHERGHGIRHPLEVVVFADEEGSMVGSRAMGGAALGPEALDYVGHAGWSVRDGVRRLGGDPGRIAEAARRPGDLLAYLELHVEQGGVLDRSGVPIGVVEGIVGIAWWEVVVEGSANHAGTTPMDQRRDALLAAARLVLAVEDVVTARPGRHVGTVGRLRVEPGAPNVVPGRAVMSLELRDLSMGTVESLFEEIRERATAIAARSGTRISFQPLDTTARPALTDPRLRRVITEAAEALGLDHLALPSGAGHDAQNLAPVAPIGMIFVPSEGGVSHAPEEHTLPGDVARGADVLLQTLLRVDAGALDEPRPGTATPPAAR